MRIAGFFALATLLSISQAEASSPPVVNLPACPQASRALWLDAPGPRSNFTLAGRSWSIPTSLVGSWSTNDLDGSSIDLIFRVAPDGYLTDGHGWKLDDTNHDPGIMIHMRSLGDVSPPTPDILIAKTKSLYDSGPTRISLWGLAVDEYSSPINIHLYHALNTNLPLLTVCHDRWPKYNGPFYPQCIGYQPAWDLASMTYYIPETRLSVLPIVDSCIYQMIDDLSKSNH